MFEIELNPQQDRFAPGDLIQGKVVVRLLPASTSQLAIRLLWYTTGKGTRDVNICSESTRIVESVPQEDIAFEFIAPHRPLSFTGQLISLQWAIEAVAFPSKQSALRELVIAYAANEIKLINASEDLKGLGIKKPVVRVGGS